METQYRMLQHGAATVAASPSPDLAALQRREFEPVIWTRSRPIRRTRTFRNLVLILLFTACLSGISFATAAGFALLNYLR